MATLKQYTEALERAVTGGVKSDESKFDFGYLSDLAHKGRAVVARNDFTQYRRWNPSLIQYYYPVYSTYFQSGTCMSRFKIPTGFISADGMRTGCTYVGSSNDMEGANPLKAQNFRIIKYRAELNDFLNHPLMTPASGNYIGVLIEGLVVEVYGSSVIKNLAIGGVWDDPTKMPDYNIDKDQYPISEDLLELVTTYIKDAVLNQAAATQSDTISDSKNTFVPMSTGRRVQRNIVK